MAPKQEESPGWLNALKVVFYIAFAIGAFIAWYKDEYFILGIMFVALALLKAPEWVQLLVFGTIVLVLAVYWGI